MAEKLREKGIDAPTLVDPSEMSEISVEVPAEGEEPPDDQAEAEAKEEEVEEAMEEAQEEVQEEIAEEPSSKSETEEPVAESESESEEAVAKSESEEPVAKSEAEEPVAESEAEEAVAKSEAEEPVAEPEAEEPSTPAVVDVLKDALADARSERDEAQTELYAAIKELKAAREQKDAAVSSQGSGGVTDAETAHREKLMEAVKKAIAEERRVVQEKAKALEVAAQEGTDVDGDVADSTQTMDELRDATEKLQKLQVAKKKLEAGAAVYESSESEQGAGTSVASKDTVGDSGADQEAELAGHVDKALELAEALKKHVSGDQRASMLMMQIQGRRLSRQDGMSSDIDELLRETDEVTRTTSPPAPVQEETSEGDLTADVEAALVDTGAEEQQAPFSSSVD